MDKTFAGVLKACLTWTEGRERWKRRTEEWMDGIDDAPFFSESRRYLYTIRGPLDLT